MSAETAFPRGRPAATVAGECPIPCNLCGSTDIEEISARDRHGKYLRTTICRSCGLVWSNPRPTEEEIRRYYSRQYRLDYKGRSTPSPRHVARSGRGALSRYRDLKPFLRPDHVILDVGAGGGEFVYVLRQLGYEARGIEPDEQYARHARENLRAPVETGFVQDVSLPSGSFSVVTMYHSLEHVEDPSGILSKLRPWLRPGGLLIVEVPNVEAACQAPHHRFHFAHFFSFNRVTLEALGRKAGFEPVQTLMSDDGGNLTCTFRSIAHGQDIVALPGNCARIVGAIRGHRMLSHLLSAAPYAGAFGRFCAYLADSAAARGCSDARHVLDTLLTRHRTRETHE